MFFALFLVDACRQACGPVRTKAELVESVQYATEDDN